MILLFLSIIYFFWIIIKKFYFELVNQPLILMNLKGDKYLPDCKTTANQSSSSNSRAGGFCCKVG